MVSSGTRKSRLLSRSRCLLLLVLLPFGLAAPSLHGQTQTTHTWNGGVETCVPPGPNAGRPTGTAECSWPSTTLTVNRGDSATYYLRLTASPTADNWWVMLRVKNSEGDVLLDGESSGGVRWVPSIGREIHQHNWNQWHSVSVRADDDAELSTLTFDHEVWDDDAECPVHDAAPVTVRVVAKDSDDGGEDGGDNGGEDNGGEDNGEDNGGEDNGGEDNGEDNGGEDNGEDNGGEDNGEDNGGEDNGEDNGGEDKDNGGEDNGEDNGGEDNGDNGGEDNGEDNGGEDNGQRRRQRRRRQRRRQRRRRQRRRQRRRRQRRRQRRRRQRRRQQRRRQRRRRHGCG